MNLVNEFWLLLGKVLSKTNYFRGKFRLIKLLNSKFPPESIVTTPLVDEIAIKVDLSVYNESLFYFKAENYTEYDSLKKICKNKTSFIDCGANIGTWSLVAAKNLSSPNSKVYSFEPNRTVFKKLKENVTLNNFPNIDLFPYAVSDMNKTVFFTNYRDHVTNHIVDDPSQSDYSVKAVSLDSAFKNKDIDIIKIDVEGFEYEVLRGAEEVIDRNPSIEIIIEFNPWILNYKEIGKWPCFSFLSEKGFKFMRLTDENNSYIISTDCFDSCVNLWCKRV